MGRSFLSIKLAFGFGVLVALLVGAQTGVYQGAAHARVEATVPVAVPPSRQQCEAVRQLPAHGEVRCVELKPQVST